MELDYYIDKRSRRRGYASEIAKALIEHAFTAKGLSEVIER